MRRSLLLATLITAFLSVPLRAQTRWYKFNKAFIEQHYSSDGAAIGALRVSEIHPAKNVHSISCGGNDGELHIGIPASALRGPVAQGESRGNSELLGMVAEPPNVQRSSPFFQAVEHADGTAAQFYGYFRLWNEGHDVGPVYPSNPHHVLELHPIWGVRSAGFSYKPDARVILPMQQYSGYGASKFVPVLLNVSHWLRVADGGAFVYVQLIRADNFYQLPVVIKQIRPVANGKGIAALVDVFSDTGHQHLVYSNLTVVTATNSRIASVLRPNWATYLLGFFSVNLKRTIEIAAGHNGLAGAVSAPGALEFFAFGVPAQHAVSASSPCTEEDD